MNQLMYSDSRSSGVSRWERRGGGKGGLARVYLFLALGGLLITGCGKPVRIFDAMDSATAAQLVNEVIRDSMQKRGNASPLFSDDSTQNVLPWKVHIDLSSTMQGFVKAPNSALSLQIEDLHKHLPTDSIFLGEGAVGSSPETNFANLKKPGSYVSTGLDYSNLFARLTSEHGYNHILLTDSILLNNRQILPPRLIADGLKEYLAKGGDFALLVFRMNFHGDYTSVTKLEKLHDLEPATDALVQDVDTDSRPLLLWVFMPPGQPTGSNESPMSQLEEYLNLSPTSAMGGTSSYGNWECLFMPKLDRQKLELIETNLPAGYKAGTQAVQGFNAIHFEAFPDQKEGVHFDFKAYVPVESLGGNNLDPTGLLDLLRTNVQVDVDCWSVTNLEPPGLSRLAYESPDVTWENLDASAAGRVPGCFHLGVRLIRPHLTDTVSTPDNMIIMFTVRPNIVERQTRLWQELADLSTEDDGDPQSANRIYGLADTLGLVNSECSVYARTLVFTEWGH